MNRLATSTTLIVLVAMVLSSTAIGAAASPDASAKAASVCSSSPGLHVCFTSPPTQGGRDAGVIDRFTALFDAAGAGDTLRVAMFRWDIPGPARALIEAQKRGARVEVVADDDLRTKVAGRRVLNEIEKGDPARRNVVVCQGSCLPWRAAGPYPPLQNVQHLKMVVGDVGGRRYLATSSANLEARQYPQYNSLIEISDPGLYAFGVRYFRRLQAQRTLGWNDRKKTYSTGTVAAAVYPNRNDLLLSTLNSVRCVPGARTVDAMLSVLQRHDIRNQLGRLQRSGCRVRVLTTRDLNENFVETKVKLPDGSTIDIPDNQVRTVHTHDKMVAIHAKVKGRKRFVVVTGTSNSTCGGLHYNDEIMIRLESRWLHQQYTGHFNDAFRHSHQTKQTLVPTQLRCR